MSGLELRLIINVTCDVNFASNCHVDFHSSISCVTQCTPPSFFPCSKAILSSVNSLNVFHSTLMRKRDDSLRPRLPVTFWCSRLNASFLFFTAAQCLGNYFSEICRLRKNSKVSVSWWFTRWHSSFDGTIPSMWPISRSSTASWTLNQA